MDEDTDRRICTLGVASIETLPHHVVPGKPQTVQSHLALLRGVLAEYCSDHQGLGHALEIQTRSFASNLKISKRTVKNQRKIIVSTLDANDRTQAVSIGLKRGVLDP